MVPILSLMLESYVETAKAAAAISGEQRGQAPRCSQRDEGRLACQMFRIGLVFQMP